MAEGLIALLLAAAAPAAQPATLPPPLIEQVDLDKTPKPMPGANAAMLVLRPWAAAMAGDNRILLHRYDPATGKVLRDAAGKAMGVKITFSYTVFGGKKGDRPLRVAIVPAGDYVLAGRTFNLTYTDAFCFGAPRFTAAAGEALYLGDYEMLALAKMPDRERRNAMRYSADLEATRSALAAVYPAYAPKLALWAPVNGTRLACEGDEFTAYAIPGAGQGETPAGH